MKPIFGDYVHSYANKGRCCAQFIISKSVVRRRSKEFYQQLYDWLLKHTSCEGNGSESDTYSGFYTGRYLEWSWKIIFS
jgi:hypothetical protein